MNKYLWLVSIFKVGGTDMLKKKLTLVVLLFSLITVNVFSLDFNWDFGTVFAGGNIGYDGSIGPEFELDAQVGDFRLESGAGFLLAYSPFNFWGVLNGRDDPDIILMTFGNFTLGYDIFRFRKDAELIPYIACYLGAIGEWDKFRVDCGVLFNLYADLIWPVEIQNAQKNNHLRGEILAAKAGIRLNQGQPQLYADLGFNLIALGMAFCHDVPQPKTSY